jgi:hypothetical protein
VIHDPGNYELQYHGHDNTNESDKWLEDLKLIKIIGGGKLLPTPQVLVFESSSEMKQYHH